MEIEPRPRGEVLRLASDVVALTSLPSRWAGASAERIADDVAASLHHLCADLEFVGVRILVPPSRPAEAQRPIGTAYPGWQRADEAPREVMAENEAVVPIGLMGRHGEIMLVGRIGQSLGHERLLAVIAANQIESASRALDLEYDVVQAHEKLAVLGKLGALGQLVGGVAHEVRTPLTYATNHVYSLESALRRAHGEEAVATAAPHLREIESALDRIGAIVHELRKFAKQPVAIGLEEDMRDLVRDALRLWRATHAGQGAPRERLAPTPPVMADRGQLQQVVLNLVQNGADATKGNGTVTVETSDEGTHALLVVEDDGPGIPPDLMRRLFEPFQTTKRDGLGLGLSIVRGIVEAHRGSIRIDTLAGRGTRVEVRIPRA